MKQAARVFVTYWIILGVIAVYAQESPSDKGRLSKAKQMVKDANAAKVPADATVVESDAPIIRAAKGGDAQKVKQLLQEKPALAKAMTERGQTVLAFAASAGQKEVVILLLENSADPNAAKFGSGFTPLHSAAMGGHVEIAKLLIDKGAKVDAKDKFDRMPLHLAAAYGANDLIEVLVAAKAEINVKDKKGMTALDHAQSNAKAETVTLLRKHGGKSGKEMTQP